MKVSIAPLFDASLSAVAARVLTPLLLLVAFATPAAAAEHLQGSHIPLWEGLPFTGLLLSIALGPILAKRVWHVHYGLAAAFWAVLTLVLLIETEGFRPSLTAFTESMVDDYIPFILMLFALYTTAGGIVVSDLDKATPASNTVLLAIGTLVSSLVGPIAASMILIRPVLQTNAGRRRQAHVVIFFIFLVSNIGGVVTPLGNPPLFFGFLRGVDFFWPLHDLWPQMLLAVAILLLIFFVIDHYAFRQDKRAQRVKETGVTGKGEHVQPHPAEAHPAEDHAVEAHPGAKIEGAPTSQMSDDIEAAEEAEAGQEEELRLSIKGLPNIMLIAATVAVILTSAVWHPGVEFDLFGVHLELQNLLRDGCLLAIGLVSLAVTPEAHHKANRFAWDPLIEVAKLFAAIFVCIIPVMAMLAATRHGPFAPIIALLSHPGGTPDNVAYFWATGLLSSFLDNGPTYLVFYVLAGGHAAVLMGPLAKTLAAISVGAVFMGALTYIGNAPNFMVYAIAHRARVAMPSFFGYMVWSVVILAPVFILITYLFFV